MSNGSLLQCGEVYKKPAPTSEAVALNGCDGLPLAVGARVVQCGDAPTPPESTSIVPVVFDGGWVPAQADVEGNLAKVFELSDGTYLHSGNVTVPGHGFTVGETYYLSQTTPGAFVTPEPTSGYLQQMFHVVDADTLAVDIEQAITYVDDLTPPAPTPEFAKTVYFDGADPADATTFSETNPLGATDATLEDDTANIYYSADDASTWIYNSDTGVYEAYQFPETEPIVVTANLAARSIPNSSPTFLGNWQTQTNTSNGGWNPATGIFTVPRTGSYSVMARVMYSSASWPAGREANVTIRKGTAVLTSAPTFVAVTGTQFVITGTAFTTQRLTAGEQIRFAVFQDSGAAKTTYVPQFSSMSITEIR